MNSLEKRLISLQQKLEHLNAEMATLIALASSEKTIDSVTDVQANPSIGSITSTGKRSSVGLNRYHQLRTHEGAL
ncbi:hypothetical protein [Spirosoma foliorum]|uniref:Uncharacterized protein n=1 Tax=Spirosoma foliorum TaxID=2710596 RepID=A0A7G5GNG9_9BACT|nr:hypothetical protein [Spirosoma foliorum]QMW00411.1 hypothetical protein H3H32_20625 [Spirosoma foliorum]